MRNLPGPGIEPALVGGFLSIVPPGESYAGFLLFFFFFLIFISLFGSAGHLVMACRI